MTYESTYFLVSLADAKAYLQVTDVTDDTMIGNILSCVTYWMERYTRRKLCSRQLTEYYTGRGRRSLRLRNWPTSSTNSTIDVRDDTSYAWGTDTKLASTSIVIDDDLAGVSLVDTVFMDGYPGNVKIVYTAGYALGSVPYHFVAAAYELVGLLWQRKTDQMWSKSNVNVVQGGVSILDRGVPPIVEDLLDGEVSHWKDAA